MQPLDPDTIARLARDTAHRIWPAIECYAFNGTGNQHSGPCDHATREIADMLGNIDTRISEI